MIEEKEAKEDQGDDRLQVGRIGVEIFWGFHGVRLNGYRRLFEPSWELDEWVQGVVLAFEGCVWMGAGIDVWFHGVCSYGHRDWYGRTQKKPDTGSRRCSAGIRLGGWGIEVSYGFR